jgi:hypothetical protein
VISAHHRGLLVVRNPLPWDPWLRLYYAHDVRPYTQRLADAAGRAHGQAEDYLVSRNDVEQVFAAAGAIKVQVLFVTFSVGDLPRKQFTSGRTLTTRCTRTWARRC